MSKIRVLIVDDAVVVRQLVSQAIAAEPDLEVAGTAVNGRKALDRLAALSPDVVLLDLEMPEMDGLETLSALRQVDPHVAVIMFSRHTQRGVEATVNALMLGANDYVPKPGAGLGVADCNAGQLLPKGRLHGARSVARRASAGQGSAPARRPAGSLSLERQVEVVGIGCSTGGPNALAEVVPALPRDWSV